MGVPSRLPYLLDQFAAAPSGPAPGLGYHGTMAKIVNLTRARKARDRAEKRKSADENAAKFGRTKARKGLEEARAEKARRDLDGHEAE